MFERLFSEGGLSLERLRVLVEVAEAGSIAAATDDPIRQSQYSRQLRELAEFFGVELARRSGRTLKLTAHGETLAAIGREKLRSLEDFWCECRTQSEEYTLGGGDSVLQWLVLPAVARARRTATMPAFRLVGLRTTETIARLQDLSLDMGFVRADAVPAGLKHAKAGRLDYVLVVPADMIPRNKTPDLAWVLQHLPLATQASDGQFTQRLRDIGNARGLTVRLALACESFTQTHAALRTRAFAAVLPRLAAVDLDAKAFRVIESRELAPLTREMVMVWNSRLTRVRPKARQVVELLLRGFAT